MVLPVVGVMADGVGGAGAGAGGGGRWSHTTHPTEHKLPHSSVDRPLTQQHANLTTHQRGKPPQLVYRYLNHRGNPTTASCGANVAFPNGRACCGEIRRHFGAGRQNRSLWACGWHEPVSWAPPSACLGTAHLLYHASASFTSIHLHSPIHPSRSSAYRYPLPTAHYPNPDLHLNRFVPQGT